MADGLAPGAVTGRRFACSGLATLPNRAAGGVHLP
jgi:hypothetical protein